MTPLDRPVGFPPTLTPVREASPTPPATTTTATVAAPPPQTDLKPKDASSATGTPTTSVAAATGMQALPEASELDTSHFLETNQSKPLKALSVVGDHVIASTDTHVIKMKLADVETAMRDGTLKADSPVARALVVHEAAVTSGLSAGATRAIMASYNKALAEGKSPVAAQAVALTNISTAMQVEAYVANKNGLATDVRRTADYTKDAMAGDHLGAIRNRTVDAEAVKGRQATLDSHLNAFTDAFATARETGDYGAAFDKLQEFFAVSAKVADTPYWRDRPTSVIDALKPEKEGPRAGAVPTKFVELLHVANSRPLPAKAVTVAPAAAPTAAGGIVSNLKARVLNFFGKTTPAVQSDVAPQAANKLMLKLAGQDAAAPKAFTGEIYKAPEPVVVVVTPPERHDIGRPVSRPRSDGLTPIHHSEQEWGVAQTPAIDKKGEPGFIERNLKEQFSGLREGRTLDLSGSFGASIGFSFDAVSLIPVAGPILTKTGALTAEVRASLGADASKKATITALPGGQIAMTVTMEATGGGSVGGTVGSKLAGLAASADGSGKVGSRSIVNLTFNSAADAAKWLSQRGTPEGLTQGTTVSAGNFTATAKSEAYLEMTGELSGTTWISSSEKSSLSVLPGIRTTTVTVSSQFIDGATPAQEAEALEFELATYAGTSSGGPVSSQVGLTAIKRVDATGKPTFEAPTVEVGLNIKKMMNLTKLGTEGEEARTRILNKMAERLTLVLNAGNAQGFEGKIEVSDVRAKLDVALRTLQREADGMFGGEGVKQQSKMGALGVSLMRGDLAKLSFKLETGADGKLTLGAAAIGVENTTKLSLEIGITDEIGVHGEVAAVKTREAETAAHAPIMPRTAATTGTDVPIHSADAGYFHAVRQTDAMGKFKLVDPVVSLKMPYDDLMGILGKTSKPSKQNEVVDAVMTRLIDDLGTKAQAEGLDGPIDREKSKGAFMQALMMMGADYDALKAASGKTNFAITSDDFAAHVRDKTYRPMAQKVMLDFRLEKGPDGKYSLKPPLDNPEAAAAFKKRGDEAFALEQRKAAEVPERLDTVVDHVGFMQARLDSQGVRVPVIGLKDKMEDVFTAFDQATPSDPEHGIKQWAEKMVNNLSTAVLAKARSSDGFTGHFDREQMKETLINAGRVLRDQRSAIASLDGKATMIKVGPGMEIRIEPRESRFKSGHKLTLQFQAFQAAEDPTQWRLPAGRITA